MSYYEECAFDGEVSVMFMFDISEKTGVITLNGAYVESRYVGTDRRCHSFADHHFHPGDDRPGGRCRWVKPRYLYPLWRRFKRWIVDQPDSVLCETSRQIRDAARNRKLKFHRHEPDSNTPAGLG